MNRARQTTIRALLAALALALTARAADEVVARVGAHEVTASELRVYVETLAAEERAALAKDPALLSRAVRTYLARRAVLEAALAKKWDEQPAVKAQLERVRENALTELYLQSVSEPPAGYPSDAEVQAVYQAEANEPVFEAPRQLRLAQIFVAAAKEGEEKAREKIDGAVKQLHHGADFAAVARETTEERGAAERGGEIGWLAEAQMVPAIRAAVAGLSAGTISAPIRLDDGFHLIKVLEVRPAHKRPLAEVKDAIIARLRSERAQANGQAYLSRLLEQDPPAINELALSKVLEPQR